MNEVVGTVLFVLQLAVLGMAIDAACTAGNCCIVIDRSGILK